MKWLLWGLALVLAINFSIATVQYSLQHPQIFVYNNLKNVLESDVDKRFIDWDKVVKTLNKIDDNFVIVYTIHRALTTVSIILWLVVIFRGIGMALWRWFN